MGAYPILAAISLPVIALSGGLGFSAAGGEPSWLVTLMSYLPAEPVIDAMTRALRYAAGEGGGAALAWRDLAVLAVWVILGAVGLARLFRWDPKVSGKRRARPAAA
jgi:hypothetical protein